MLWLLLLGWVGLSPSFYPPEALALPAVQHASPAIISFRGGCGFLVSPGGLILTNHHVAETFSDWGVAHRDAVGSHPGEPLEVILVTSHPHGRRRPRHRV
jgi:S1-C subfamily serine protease